MAGLIWTQSTKSLSGGGGGSTGPGANEPAGYTKVNEIDMTLAPSTGTANSVGLTYTGDFTDVTVNVADATGPVHPQSWDLRWPAGDNLGGSSPGHKFQYGRPNDGTFPAHSVGLYSKMWFKMSTNYTHYQNSGTKFWFTKNGQTMNSFCGFVAPGASTGVGQNNTNCTFFYGTQGSIAAAYQGNAEITKGAWVQWEQLLEYGTAGSANGRCRQWADGVLVVDTGSAVMIASGEGVPQFIWVDDVYGFGNGPTPSFDMHWYINDWYISVK